MVVGTGPASNAAPTDTALDRVTTSLPGTIPASARAWATWAGAMTKLSCGAAGRPRSAERTTRQMKR